MPEDLCSNRPLFGGAISSAFPLRFQDVSNVRQVPDHQEAFVDPTRDESLIFELLDLKTDVADQGSATWFLQDLANEQDAEGTLVLEQSGVFEADGLRFRSSPGIITTAVEQMAVSKGRQGREAQNIVKVYLANLRLKDVATDVLITAYDPVVINPLSKSADTVGAGSAVPAAQPTLRGHPTAVVLYNSSEVLLYCVMKPVNMVLRQCCMLGDEAKSVCPDIQLVQVPTARGKAHRVCTAIPV